MEDNTTAKKTTEKGFKLKFLGPVKISFSGWKKIAGDVHKNLREHNVAIISGGVAFYFFLAVFPAITAIVFIYGMLTDPVQIEKQMSQLTTYLPKEVHQFVSESLQGIVKESGNGLGWGALASTLLGTWIGNVGTRALFKGVGMAYEEDEKRGFLRENAVTLIFTVAGIFLFILIAGAIVVFPAIADFLSFDRTLINILEWCKWPVLALIVVYSLALVYKYAPYQSRPKFRWTTWGATVATVLWLGGTAIFSLFMSTFGLFNTAYGAMAAVVMLLLWFLITSFAIILGAEINVAIGYELEREAGRKSGPEETDWH